MNLSFRNNFLIILDFNFWGFGLHTITNECISSPYYYSAYNKHSNETINLRSLKLTINYYKQY